MIRIHPENGSEPSTSSSARRSSAAALLWSGLLPRTLLHSRAMLRLLRRRPQFALGIAVAGGVVAAGTTTSVLLQRASSAVEPLAPAPRPPAPPIAAVHTKHHFFSPKAFAESALHANPLRGLASWYGSVWEGRKTASGETYAADKLTAAHRSLPLGTLVRVTNLDSMRSVVVKINDRGSLAPGRVIDLSTAAARELGMVERGLAHVKLEILGKS